MNKRHMIAVAATIATIVFGAAGAVAAAHPLTGASENGPAAVDPPEGGDGPDAPAPPDLPEPGDASGSLQLAHGEVWQSCWGSSVCRDPSQPRVLSGCPPWRAMGGSARGHRAVPAARLVEKRWERIYYAVQW